MIAARGGGEGRLRPGRAAEAEDCYEVTESFA